MLRLWLWTSVYGSKYRYLNYIGVLLLLVFTCNESLCDLVSLSCFVAEKPGVCPSNDPRYCFRSEDRCFHDSNCPDDLKCCSDGCGRQCMAPNRGI